MPCTHITVVFDSEVAGQFCNITHATSTHHPGSFTKIPLQSAVHGGNAQRALGTVIERHGNCYRSAELGHHPMTCSSLSGYIRASKELGERVGQTGEEGYCHRTGGKQV